MVKCYSNSFLPYLFSKANTSWRLHYLKSVFHCNAWQHSGYVHYSCVNNQCRSPRDLYSFSWHHHQKCPPSPSVLGVPDLTHLCSSHAFLTKLFLTPAASPTMELGSVFLCGPTASRPALYQDWLQQQHRELVRNAESQALLQTSGITLSGGWGPVFWLVFQVLYIKV